MQPLINDATAALMRAIRGRFDAGSTVTFDEIRSRAWASVTFTGARHEMAFHVGGDGASGAADRFITGLEVAEFRLRGHILADIALAGRENVPAGGVRIRIEALTVEDA